MADELVFVDESEVEEILSSDFFQFSSVYPRTSEDFEFRVKNQSTLYTATNVSIYIEEVDPKPDPSLLGQLLLSTDTSYYSTSVNLGDMLPQEISDTITLRRVIPSNAQEGQFAFKVIVKGSSWK